MIIADALESSLGLLDLIQVFVQALDSLFENVCELDLIFNYDAFFLRWVGSGVCVRVCVGCVVGVGCQAR